MHTAEHLLSAVMKQHYQAPRNLELHLNEKKSKCDYAVPGALSDPDIARIEELVNLQISANHPVTSHHTRREQAGAYDLWKVPADMQEIRIVRIGDFDAQPCSGEHVGHTSEIGKFRITSYEARDNSFSCLHGICCVQFDLFLQLFM